MLLRGCGCRPDQSVVVHVHEAGPQLFQAAFQQARGIGATQFLRERVQGGSCIASGRGPSWAVGPRRARREILRVR